MLYLISKRNAVTPFVRQSMALSIKNLMVDPTNRWSDLKPSAVYMDQGMVHTAPKDIHSLRVFPVFWGAAYEPDPVVELNNGGVYTPISNKGSIRALVTYTLPREAGIIAVYLEHQKAYFSIKPSGTKVDDTLLEETAKNVDSAKGVYNEKGIHVRTSARL